MQEISDELRRTYKRKEVWQDLFAFAGVMYVANNAYNTLLWTKYTINRKLYTLYSISRVSIPVYSPDEPGCKPRS